MQDGQHPGALPVKLVDCEPTHGRWQRYRSGAKRRSAMLLLLIRRDSDDLHDPMRGGAALAP